MSDHTLRKMKTRYTPGQPIEYQLTLGDQPLELNSYLEKPLTITRTGKIFCVHCGRSLKKTFQQGYCFPCAKTLAETDLCMMKPELCHYASGTCRDPDWGLQHCFKPHTIYLANSSGLKVGITRNRVESRWADQGAVQGLALMEVASRKEAGDMEVRLKAFFNDKTNWRQMLKGSPPLIELEERGELLKSELKDSDLPWREPFQEVQLTYPVVKYPEKIVSLNLDRESSVGGILLGIKAQYLIFDTGVINIRKFSGYEVVIDT